MAKATFGEYGAFQHKKSLRYTKNNKMIKEDSVPVEIRDFLRKKLIPTVKNFSPEKTEDVVIAMPDDEPETESSEEDFTKDSSTEDSSTEDSFTEEDFTDVPEENHIDADFLEEVSIHSASREDIARAMYERFGIYTVYLGSMPAADEVNPLTGEQFTKYHLGVAYQAAIRAKHTGVLNKEPELGRKSIDAGRDASKSRRDAFVPRPKTLGEAKEQDSFLYRTSVRGGSGYGEQSSKGEIVNYQDEKGEWHTKREESVNGMKTVMPDGRHDFDEPIAEPPLRGKKIIRADW